MDAQKTRHPRTRAALKALKRWWSTPAAAFPPGRAGLGDRLPVPAPGPSAQVSVNAIAGVLGLPGVICPWLGVATTGGRGAGALGDRTAAESRVQGRYVPAATSPPVWANSLLTTFQVPAMRASWR
jgi:hypothetical protein